VPPITPQTDHTALAAALAPSQPGSVPKRAANHITVARYRVTVGGLRLFGLFLLGLALVVGVFHDRLLRRNMQRSEEEQIAAHLGLLVTPVEGLARPAGFASTPVLDFTSLARLAQYLERPILRQTDETGSTYAVDDDRRVYQYHAAPSPCRRTVDQAPTAPPIRRRKRLGRPRRATIAGGALALLIAITLVTSLTATTNVPTSNVGTSDQARQIGQLAPAGCASLSLTSLVIRTGTFTNTASNALVLGDAGANTITDSGTNNCIVGGGGKDIVNGDKTDVCIVGPGSGTSYRKCTTA
jgi:hypothetical protein